MPLRFYKYTHAMNGFVYEMVLRSPDEIELLKMYGEDDLPILGLSTEDLHPDDYAELLDVGRGLYSDYLDAMAEDAHDARKEDRNS